MSRFAHNHLEKSRARDLDRACREAFGPLSPYRRLLRLGARTIAESYSIATRINPFMRLPKSLRTAYRWPDPKSLPERTRIALPVLNNA